MTDGLWWDDALVLATEEAGSALVDILASSGIHSVTVEPGAESQELVRFAKLVGEKGKDDEGAKDLLMMLFRAELNLIRCSVRSGDGTQVRDESPSSPEAGAGVAVGDAASPSAAESARGPEAPAPGELKAAIRADAEAPRPSGVVDLESFDSTLYFLDEREIEYLRFEVEKQYSVDQTRSVLGLLLDTLELQADPDTRAEVIEALRAFLPYLLGSGRYTSVAYLANELRITLKKVELEDEHREALVGILRSISEKGALTQLFLTLEDGSVTPQPGSLEALVQQLDRQALETVLVWSGQLRRAEAKAALLKALESIFRQRPHHLATILMSSSRAVVQSGLAMAARLRLEELVDGLTVALGHDDAGIRKQTVDVLGSISGTPAIRGVARLLNDPHPDVRKAAYKVFLNRPYRSVARPLREIMVSTDLESLGLSERKLLFSAYGAAAGSEEVEELAQLLAGKRAFGSKPSSETRACAVLALEKMDTPAAREALEAASRYPDPLVRSAANNALRGDR